MKWRTLIVGRVLGAFLLLIPAAAESMPFPSFASASVSRDLFADTSVGGTAEDYQQRLLAFPGDTNDPYATTQARVAASNLFLEQLAIAQTGFVNPMRAKSLSATQFFEARAIEGHRVVATSRHGTFVQVVDPTDPTADYEVTVILHFVLEGLMGGGGSRIFSPDSAIAQIMFNIYQGGGQPQHRISHGVATIEHSFYKTRVSPGYLPIRLFGDFADDDFTYNGSAGIDLPSFFLEESGLYHVDFEVFRSWQANVGDTFYLGADITTVAASNLSHIIFDPNDPKLSTPSFALSDFFSTGLSGLTAVDQNGDPVNLEFHVSGGGPILDPSQFPSLPVPLPGALPLFATALSLGCVFLRRRRTH